MAQPQRLWPVQTERLKRIVEGDWGVCGGLGVAWRMWSSLGVTAQTELLPNLGAKKQKIPSEDSDDSP